jgi:peptidoglycan/LPS O-acetylase OafA/YrhL
VRAERFVRGAALVGAAVFAIPGAWAFLAPASFYEQVALFAPYNRHFLHDIGAFQLGIGAALALAPTGRPGPRIALCGAATAATLHAVAHAIDHGLGGRGADVPALALLAAALIAAAVLSPTRPR